MLWLNTRRLLIYIYGQDIRKERVVEVMELINKAVAQGEAQLMLFLAEQLISNRFYPTGVRDTVQGVQLLRQSAEKRWASKITLGLHLTIYSTRAEAGMEEGILIIATALKALQESGGVVVDKDFPPHVPDSSYLRRAHSALYDHFCGTNTIPGDPKRAAKHYRAALAAGFVPEEVYCEILTHPASICRHRAKYLAESDDLSDLEYE